MFSRRELVTGGLAAAAAARATDSGAAPAQCTDNSGLLNEILTDVQKMATPQPVPGGFAIGMVRQSQRTFLKQAGKYPDQIDVGLDTWDAVIDWHVAALQPFQIARHADGRYAIRFLTTNIVLKPELPENYVSQGQ